MKRYALEGLWIPMIYIGRASVHRGRGPVADGNSWFCAIFWDRYSHFSVLSFVFFYCFFWLLFHFSIFFPLSCVSYFLFSFSFLFNCFQNTQTFLKMCENFLKYMNIYFKRSENFLKSTWTLFSELHRQ